MRSCRLFGRQCFRGGIERFLPATLGSEDLGPRQGGGRPILLVGHGLRKREKFLEERLRPLELTAPDGDLNECRKCPCHGEPGTWNVLRRRDLRGPRDRLVPPAQTGEMPDDVSHYNGFAIEDYVTQVGQGPLADRAAERLGRTDARVVMNRTLWTREPYSVG